MNEREKIIEIIAPFISAYGEDEAIADALIAAGIGNIRETEHRDEVAERTAMVLAKWWANETDYSWKTWFNAAQEQAEEELAEEKGE